MYLVPNIGVSKWEWSIDSLNEQSVRPEFDINRSLYLLVCTPSGLEDHIWPDKSGCRARLAEQLWKVIFCREVDWPVESPPPSLSHAILLSQYHVFFKGWFEIILFANLGMSRYRMIHLGRREHLLENGAGFVWPIILNANIIYKGDSLLGLLYVLFDRPSDLVSFYYCQPVYLAAMAFQG